jgi:hypothetical protein
MGLFRRTPGALIALAATGVARRLRRPEAGPGCRARGAARRPAALQGQAARAAGAVGGLSAALRAGDVERVCRPNAVLTAAVVAEMNSGGASCEATVESMLTDFGPPRLTVLGVALEPDLATAPCPRAQRERRAPDAPAVRRRLAGQLQRRQRPDSPPSTP